MQMSVPGEEDDELLQQCLKAIEGDMKAKGLVGRARDPGSMRWPDWVSRDYAAVLKCETVGCFLHANGQCSSPAAVTMSAGGRCAVYQKQLVREAEIRSGSGERRVRLPEGD